MILVFAGKQVGRDVLKFMVERRDPIGLVVCSSDDDRPIADLCGAAAIACETFGPEVVARIGDGGLRYDWLVNAWSSHILRKPVLDAARRHANLHPSLVPHARGADSWAWILRRGLPAGVSLLEMTDGVDAGGVYAQSRVDVPFPTRGSALRDALQREMVALFRRSWPGMLTGRIEARPQEEGGSYFRRRDTNQDRVKEAGEAMTLGDVVQWALAHDFSPGTTAEMMREGRRYRITVGVERIEESE